MREILFRGKTTPKEKGEFNNIWVFGDLIYSDGKYYIHPQSNVVSTNGEIGQRIVMHEVIPETVSQWTGLVDKNGVAIFEGDVVVYKDGMATVQYNLTHASFLLLERSAVMGLRYFYLDEIITNTCNVIGNIWDNPELGVRDESE